MTDTLSVQARATAKYVPVSPTKVRPVLSLIRGLAAEDAERALQICQRGAADDVFKLLESAIANAENVRQIPPDELFVAACWADEGPTRKSGRPRARGRYARIRKRSSHITIQLARFSPEEIEARRENEERRGGSASEARRRRAERVERSKAAKQERRAAEHEEHDHDHDHDEDHDHDDEVVTDEEEIMAADEAEADDDAVTEEATEASAEAVDEPTEGEES